MFRFDITEGPPTVEQLDATLCHLPPLDFIAGFSARVATGYAYAIQDLCEFYTVSGFDDPECGPSYEEAEPSYSETGAALRAVFDYVTGS